MIWTKTFQISRGHSQEVVSTRYLWSWTSHSWKKVFHIKRIKDASSLTTTWARRSKVNSMIRIPIPVPGESSPGSGTGLHRVPRPPVSLPVGLPRPHSIPPSLAPGHQTTGMRPVSSRQCHGTGPHWTLSRSQTGTGLGPCWTRGKAPLPSGPLSDEWTLPLRPQTVLMSLLPAGPVLRRRRMDFKSLYNMWGVCENMNFNFWVLFATKANTLCPRPLGGLT